MSLGAPGDRPMARNSPYTALRLALILALVAAWFGWPMDRGHACSCVDSGSPAEAWERSAAVFAGRVVSIDQSISQTGWNSITVEFDVSTVWKGPGQRTMRMTNPGINNSCHFPFQEGIEYLVYSHNRLEVSWCSPIRLLSEATKDLAELGERQVLYQTATAPRPTPIGPEQPTGGGCGPSPQADGLLVAGLVVGLAWLGLRKRVPGDR